MRIQISLYSNILDQKVNKLFSDRGQTVNTLGIMGHSVTVTITQLCYCSTNTAIDKNK